MRLIGDQAENRNEMYFFVQMKHKTKVGLKGRKPNKIKLLDSDILLFQFVDFGSNRVELVLHLILPTLCFS